MQLMVYTTEVAVQSHLLIVYAEYTLCNDDVMWGFMCVCMDARVYGFMAI